MAFFETSAMDGTNVNAAFRILVERKKLYLISYINRNIQTY